MNRCWRPGCRLDAPHQLAGDDWTVWSCDRDLATAQAVTGDRPPRGRAGQMELDLNQQREQQERGGRE